jgi:hypothetical protein
MCGSKVSQWSVNASSLASFALPSSHMAAAAPAAAKKEATKTPAPEEKKKEEVDVIEEDDEFEEFENGTLICFRFVVWAAELNRICRLEGR